jgi:hypothetical protein
MQALLCESLDGLDHLRVKELKMLAERRALGKVVVHC